MTSPAFKRMKDSSKETLERLQRLTSYDSDVKKGTKYIDRINTAISGLFEFDHMRECNNGAGKACFSVFCNHCKSSKQNRMYDNYRQHFLTKYNHNEQEIRDHARFGTVLHSLVPVNVETDALEHDTIEGVIDACAQIKSYFQAIKRSAYERFGAKIHIEGGIHIELVDFDRWRFAEMTGRQTHKQKTYNDFFDSSPCSSSSDHYFLVHTHFLCDIDSLKDKEMNALFRKHWNQTSRQVLLKRLTQVYETGMGDVKHDLDTAFRNIANYCYTGSNHRLAYAKNWGNSGKVVETRTDSKGSIRALAKEVYDSDIQDELSLGHLRLLIQIHNELTNRNAQGLRIQIR